MSEPLSPSGPTSGVPVLDDGPRARRTVRTQRLLVRARPLLVSTASIAFFVAVWWAVAAAEIWDPVFVPSPGAVWQQFVALTVERDGVRGYNGYLLQEHLLVSLRRIAVGAGLGVLLGIVIGLLTGTIPLVRAALEPPITFLRQLPPLAYFSLLIIWLGIDESPKIWLLLIATMPPVAVATSAAVMGVPQDFLHAARSLGASRADVLRDVVLPATLPDILTGIRVGVGVAYTSVVAAETVNGIPGIGGMIRDAQRYNQTDVVILGILVLGISGLLIDAALRHLQHAASPWRARG